MTNTQSTTPSTAEDTILPPDVLDLIDEAYASGLDYGPNLAKSTMQLLAKDRSVLREVHWAGVGVWTRNVIDNALAAQAAALAAPQAGTEGASNDR